MTSLLKKQNLLQRYLCPKKALFLLSIVAITSIYSDQQTPKACKHHCKKSTTLSRCPPTNAAYSYPACVKLDRSWNVYTEISFNYWQPIQENMELGQMNNGSSTNITSEGLTITSLNTTDSFQDINMSFNFNPSFTVGLGVNFDHDYWDIRAQYTWFHTTNTQNAIASNFMLFHSNTQNISPTWGTLLDDETNVVYQFASERWKLGMDLIDLELGRSYYLGHKLIIHPRFGVRAALIRQKVQVAYDYGFTDYTVDLPGLLGSGVLVEDKNIVGATHSWALGPKISLETHWLLGAGFRFFGNAEADILYTRYTTLQESTVTTGTVMGNINFIPFNFDITDTTSTSQNSLNCLRTHLDLDLGFGWGSYFNCNKFHFDFSAGYEFQVFFDQNMFRNNITSSGSYLPNGNLYIQGLTAKLKLNF